MKKYLITKIKVNNVGQEILLYPPTQGDEIYEYFTYEEATENIEKLKQLKIYKDIELIIIETTYNVD
jgi:hypothetical protein